MLVVAKQTPWYENVRERIFVLPGCPFDRWYARTSLSADSFASDPEFEKNTRLMPAGAYFAMRSARRIVGSVVELKNDG